MRKNKIMIATLAAIATQVIFGFSFMFTKIALRYASPFTVIADRYIIALAGLTLVVLFSRRKIKINKNIWKVALMAIFQPVLYFLLETYGIKLTTSAFSSVIISLTPVVTVLLGIFCLREKPVFTQYVFMLLSVAGVVLLSCEGRSDGVVTLAGVLCLFGALLSSSVYMILSRKLSAEYSAFDRTYVMAVVGTVAFVMLALLENRHAPLNLVRPFMQLPYMLSLLYLGVLSSVVAFLCLNFASSHLPVAKTTVFSGLNMLVSVSAGILFLQEPFSWETAVSAVMILVGVCGVQVVSVEKCKK
ncbi:MAG: DMT family transporter [Clostridia bacterium]|nr:DMT family transporter [Clostridia bacterium]